jgi:large subunit ribosomal protein L9
MMKIVLRTDVENVGNKGDLVDVADGFARNYLVPKGLALPATPGIQKQADAMRRNRAAKDRRDREAAEAVATQLSGRTITIEARAGEGGRLFGSVTAADVAEAVQAQAGVVLDRRKIALAEPLKELGAAELAIRLHAEVTAMVTVEVVTQA